MKRYFNWRIILGCLSLLVLAAWAMPEVTEGWYRERMLKALEAGLGRKVEIGQVRFRLVPTPGYAISDVRIGEDPAVGQEPAAYVDTLVARPSLLALLQGKLTVGSVRLEDASLNLTRVDNGPGGVHWNFSSVAAGTRATAFPDIHMAGGRVNFKFGDTKSIFYLLDTDVDLTPSTTPDGPLKIRMGGEPARTDKPSRGFGSFVASGQWNFADHSLELDVRLEKSELSDVLSLFQGGSSGLLGTVWGDAHLAGPMSKIGVAGHMNVINLHGWNQSPPGGSAFPFTIGGTINATGQVIDLEATAAGKPSPLTAHFRMADYLGRPGWYATVKLDGVPVAPLTGIARNFGITVPPDLTLDGTARGSVGYWKPGEGRADLPGWKDTVAPTGPGFAGQIRIFDTTLAAKDSPSLKIAQADVVFDGTSIKLPPTSIRNDAGESSLVDAIYDTASGEMQASLSSEGMAIASVRRQISVIGAPIIGLATAGVWSGNLHYEHPGKPAADATEDPVVAGWTGDIHLKDTDISFEAFAQPVHVIEADATIDSTGATIKKIRLTIAGIAAQGDYRYEIGAEHPHRFHMVLPSASAEDLETVFTPALRRAGFLTYAFNFGRVPQPDWLRDMHADGSVQVTSLTLGGTQIANLRANVLWDGSEVKLSGATAKVSGAAFAGDAALHLAGRQPDYEVNGHIAGFAWQGGTLTATGSLNASGMGADLLSSLKAEGTFTGRKLEVGKLNPWDAAEGHFEFTVSKATPRLRLSDLVIQSGGAKWNGVAETQDSGETFFKLTDGARHMEASGAVLRGEALKPAP